MNSNVAKKVFLAGIGGIGVSGLALMLLKKQYEVKGWDINESAITQRLREQGAVITTGLYPPLLEDDFDCLIHTHAIDKESAFISSAKEKGITVYERGEYLADLLSSNDSMAVSGSHGKTTITFMINHLCRCNGIDSEVYGGGIDVSLGNNYSYGKDLLVAEMDESDKTFAKARPLLTVFSNLDFEHVNEYRSFADLKQTTANFFRGLTGNKSLIINGDDMILDELAEKNFKGEELIRVGYKNHNDYIIKKPAACREYLNFRIIHKGESLDLKIKGFIRHNVLNMSLACAAFLKISRKSLHDVQGMDSFMGVKRRFEYLQNSSSEKGFLVTDYGHHPKEIKSVVDSVKESQNQRPLALIFEAHRISRLECFFEDFIKVFKRADRVYLADVHCAGESGDYESILNKIINKNSEKFFRLENEVVLRKTRELQSAGYNVIIFSAGKLDSLFRGDCL